MAAGLVVNGVKTTDFYPPNMNTPGSVNLAGGNVSTNAAENMNNGTGASGTLPSLWWLGILIVLIALRLAYEYA